MLSVEQAFREEIKGMVSAAQMMDPEGGQGVQTIPLKITKNRFLSNAGPNPLDNHKAKPA